MYYVQNEANSLFVSLLAAAADNGTGPVCRIGVRWYLRRHDERGGGERRVREDEVPRGCAKVSTKRVCPAAAAAAAAAPWRGVWCGEKLKSCTCLFCFFTLILLFFIGFER